MAKAQQRFDFTVKVGERTYDCYRIVSGTRVLTQRVHVIGYGSKNDSAPYGAGKHPVSTMEGPGQNHRQRDYRRVLNSTPHVAPYRVLSPSLDL